MYYEMQSIFRNQDYKAPDMPIVFFRNYHKNLPSFFSDISS